MVSRVGVEPTIPPASKWRLPILTYHDIGMAFVVDIIPTLFQPVGSGSHLYSAHLHTMRSDRGAEVLPTLVGLSLWDCLALPFCTLIISQVFRLVKSFFLIFLLAVRLERTSSLCRLNRRHQSQMGEPDSNGWSGTFGGLSATDAHHLCFVPLLYHTFGDLSSTFFSFFEECDRGS